LIKSTLGLFLLTFFASAQVNVLTSNYDNERTNANLHETILNQSNVNAANFGKIGYFPVDGEIYAQPLYAAGVNISGQGLHNVVYVATMHNSVYAIDADKPNSPTPLWQVNLGASVPSWVLNFNDVLPEVGILSTPVIDLTRQVIYVVSDTLEVGLPVFSLHALSLANGQEMLGGPVTISASLPGHGAGNSGGTLTFNPSVELQRPGIALSNGTLYLSFGSRGDLGNWHGWLMSYDAATLKQNAVVTTSANGYGASIWHSGLAPAIDSNGNIFVATGNGDFDGSTNFGESVLKFSGSDLTLADWYTPNTWSDLNNTDSDLGSSGVILLPATTQAVTAGKSGDLFLIQSDAMGHLGPKNTSTVQNIQANASGTHTLALWNSPSNPVLYIHESGHSLSAFNIVNGRISSTPSSTFTPSPSTIFANVAISSNSNAPGTAIVWYSVANYNASQQPGILHALDASDLTHELWNSNMAATDAMGRFAKYVVPTVANGRVYVPTFSNELVIYGLLSSAGGEQGGPQVTAVANSANFLIGAIAPGELVSIFGANLGPAMPVGAQLDNTGHLAHRLSQTKVYFNGVSAPLLYASANQVNAIVPFGISPAKIQLQVQNGSQFSPNAPVTIAPASPAIFSKDGTGGRIAAIINQNGTTNSYSNPAPHGSVITLYATGAGQTNPGGSDGLITPTGNYPVPELPVKFFIDGQAANVLYAGAAPGQVQGVIQINARVPASASTGQVQIMLQVGSFNSPNTASVIVQ